MKHYICQFSGGLSSAEAAVRIRQKHGTDNLRLVFCDTLIEDQDLYRFLIQSAAYIFGIQQDRVADIAQAALLIPELSDDEAVMAKRRQMLVEIRQRAIAAIPGLNWIADGRDPWEVFQDVRFLGNSRIDPCSKNLKRKLADRWHEENCERASTVRVLGMMFSEQHRIEAVRDRMTSDGWATEFPMDEPPLLSRVPLMQAWIDRGIQPPRLYFLGFPHNNCGGFCCKMGQASAAKLLSQLPCRYAYHEAREERFRKFIGKDVSMLSDRTGGTKKVLTLRQFRERVQSGGLYDADDRGACSCFVNDSEMAGAA